MATTYEEYLTLSEAPPAPRRSSLGRVVGLVFGVSAALFASAVLGAVILYTFGARLLVHTAPGFPVVVAAVASVVATLLLPLLLGAAFGRILRKGDPWARAPLGSTMLGWNLALVLSLMFFAPLVTRGAINHHSRWMVEGYANPLQRLASVHVAPVPAPSLPAPLASAPSLR